MAKKPLFFLISVVAIILTSCAKEYTCYCERKVGGSTEALVYKQIKLTKMGARKWCEKYNSSSLTYGKVECELK